MVLGADGFIGRHLVRALAAGDWARPIAAGRRPAPAVGDGRIGRIQIDATDLTALQAALHGIDAVVSCIAGSERTISAGAEALFTAAARQPTPPRVIFLSSMAVYGPATGSVSESAPLLGDTPYAKAKIAAEAAASAYREVVILRPGIVYGPESRQWTDRIARWLLARRLGDLGAAGDGCCNLVHVNDVVSAISQALTLGEARGRAFNLAMDKPPTWNDYLVRFARELGATPVATIGSRQLAIETRLLAPPLKVAEILCSRLRIPVHLPEPIPPSLLHLFSQDIRLESSSAMQALRVQWTGLETGLHESAAWFASVT
jgi:nucleoside-diphosphate-sugar epimerase